MAGDAGRARRILTRRAARLTNRLLSPASMAFGFRKSFRVAPGLRLNVSRRSVGVGVGRRGATVSASR
jgi:hypothetical protein